MRQTYLEAREPLKLFEFPERVIISVQQELELFLYETGITVNSQEHHEVTRQVFDYIDYGFTEFCNLMLNLPIFKLLDSFTLNASKYTDFNGNLNPMALNLKKSTQTYGLSIYMTCKKVGIFDGEKTPYILETVSNDLIILHNCFTRTHK